MSLNDFVSSYSDMLSYLSVKNPMFTEYLIEKFPGSLELPPQVSVNAKKQKKNWLMKGSAAIYQDKVRVLTPPLMDVFQSSIYRLACVYTYGSNNIIPNFERAGKYIRILKLLGDDRYKQLGKEINKRKKERNEKILERIN